VQDVKPFVSAAACQLLEVNVSSCSVPAAP
jgi:hypothetical protein